jgi:Ca-activated chloride channel family protein
MPKYIHAENDMKLKHKLYWILSLLVLTAGLSAGEVQDEDKTLSPYFMVKSDDPSVDRLPLLSTSADVNIAGVIADVKVTQVYKNDGKKPIEAVYVFPASTRAAVYAMKMTIGERTIVAEIRGREQARQEYEQAKQQGKSASLLEQERPNVFRMNVANIMPGDRIEVEMSYTELLVPTEGVYEFVYPTVVGPRYSNKPAPGARDSDQWVANPYQHEGEKPLYTFDVKVNLEAGLPIQELTCPSHKTDIHYDGATSASVQLARSERSGGNKDFILQYRLSGGKVESGLLLYPGKDENFFLAMVQPPERVEESQIPPREYIFIMDVSGSMHGYPIEISKKLLKDLIGGLRKNDCFNVLLFAGGSTVLSEKSLPATGENIDAAVNAIDRQRGGGGTELIPALKRALKLPRTRGVSRTIVIATDGYVDVEAEAFDVIRDNLGKANVFAFGIGASVNRLLIEGIAHAGMGEPFVVVKEDEAPAQAAKFRAYIRTPVLTGVRVEFEGFDAYDVEPPNLPDVLAERPVIVFGKWRGKPGGNIVLRGHSAQGQYENTFDVEDFAPNQNNAALRYLWARHRIQVLSDYAGIEGGEKTKKEVTGLGLKYNLLTAYTSFVAIDRRIRNKNGKPETVTQPLPLPEGVSDYAVGAGTGGGMGASGKMYARAAMTAPAMKESYEPKGGDTLSLPPVDTSRASVKIARLDVHGGLSEKSVRTVIEQRLSDIERAYTDALARDPGISGELELKFIIQPDGSVVSVQAAKNQLNQDLADRLEKLLKSLKYSNLPGAVVTVTLKLVFTP